MKFSEVLSVVAIVMSTVSLTWQVISWRRTGAVVKVTTTPVIVEEPDGLMVMIRASNSGRTAVTVTGWGLRCPDGANVYGFEPVKASAEIPHRLEPGAQVSWFVPVRRIQQMTRERGIRERDWVAWVDLGSGETILAKKRGIGTR